MESKIVTSAEDQREAEQVAVKISSGVGMAGEIAVRNTRQIISLEGQKYYNHRIVRPKGFDKEEFMRRSDRGYEALLSLVFGALAEVSRRRKNDGIEV
jgi:hypothetical protein